MKVAVIMGIFHMSFGIVCKMLNKIHAKDYVAFITDGVFAFIILNALFGWMDLLIFFKWFRPLNIDDTLTYTETKDPVL